MSEAKSFASLSSGLLARKGAAKPAMRRPNTGFNPDNTGDSRQDDLGWNDMGYDVDPDISCEVPSEKPANPLAKAIEVPKPEVKQQQELIAAQLQSISEIDEEILTKVDNPQSTQGTAEKHNIDKQAIIQNIGDRDDTIAVSPAKPVTRKPIVSKRAIISKKGTVKRKAAFTLRLDPERHLKLRLACAINNISAQKFVTEALDNKLKNMDQIDHLSDQIIEK